MQLTFKNKTAAAISSLALLVNTVTPVFAAVEGSTSNNTTGADSSNVSEVVVRQTTTLVQDNNANIDNNIKMNMNTGGNSANKNTGVGAVATGDVSFGAAVKNQANVNMADLDACGGCNLEINTANAKTGFDSWNKSKVEVLKENTIFQDNKADVDNNITTDINTGKNSADKNTTGGYVMTGDAEATAIVENSLNRNMARMNGGNGTGAYLSSSNDTTGADSDNESTIQVRFANLVTQSNFSDIDNKVDFKANTGRNTANKNTGIGEVVTGDVEAGVALDTSANDNFLDFAGCCDIEFVTANEKTGADSWNDSKATIDNALEAFQSNCGYGDSKGSFMLRHHNCEVDNDVFGNLNTGDNSTNKNTNDDIISGDVDAVVQVESDTNHNVLGSVTMPSWSNPTTGNSNGWGWMMMWMFGMNS